MRSSSRTVGDGVRSYEPTAPYSALGNDRGGGAGGSSHRTLSDHGDLGYPQKAAEIGNYEDDQEEVYIVRQNIGYCSIIFSGLQTIILGVMMWQCGIAPLKIK